MYEKTKTEYYYGPAKSELVVKGVLKHLKIIHPKKVLAISTV